MIQKPVRASGKKWEDVRDDFELWIKNATLELTRLVARPTQTQTFVHTFAAPGSAYVWRASRAGKVVSIAVRNGTGNAKRNAAKIVAAGVKGSATAWTVVTAGLQNVDFAVGDSLVLVSTVGAPTVQVEVEV